MLVIVGEMFGQKVGSKGTDKFSWPGYDEWERENENVLNEFSNRSSELSERLDFDTKFDK